MLNIQKYNAVEFFVFLWSYLSGVVFEVLTEIVRAELTENVIYYSQNLRDETSVRFVTVCSHIFLFFQLKCLTNHIKNMKAPRGTLFSIKLSL